MKQRGEYETIKADASMGEVRHLMQKLIETTEQLNAKPEDALVAFTLLAFTAFCGGSVGFEGNAEIAEFIGDATFFMGDWADRIRGRKPVVSH